MSSGQCKAIFGSQDEGPICILHSIWRSVASHGSFLSWSVAYSQTSMSYDVYFKVLLGFEYQFGHSIQIEPWGNCKHHLENGHLQFYVLNFRKRCLFCKWPFSKWCLQLPLGYVISLKKIQINMDSRLPLITANWRGVRTDSN